MTQVDSRINPLVVDLSHYDSVQDYAKVVREGVVGVIYKATEGGSYCDPTYTDQQREAKGYGLLWGAYHFADASDVDKQVQNFLQYCDPDPDELICLDWEDNDGNTMTVDNARRWVTMVEKILGREGQCVIYSGNTAKELLGDSVDNFFGSRRLWLPQYTTGTPVCQASWDNYWLWQYTDGNYGLLPHSIEGIGQCDISSYPGLAEMLREEWATGDSGTIPEPAGEVVSIVVYAPGDVTVKVRHVDMPLTASGRRREDYIARRVWEAARNEKR